MFDQEKVIRLSVPFWYRAYSVELPHGNKGFIAVHDINRGSALGGCRWVQYISDEMAFCDVLRLSRGMTFKNAIADLPMGGGKSVIHGDPTLKGKEREEVLIAFAEFVNFVNKNGEIYRTAEDMNIGINDARFMREICPQVVGVDVDPSPFTSYGVGVAIVDAVRSHGNQLFGQTDVKGLKILVEGIGKVGYRLGRDLVEAGAQVVVADRRKEAVESFLREFPGSTSVEVDNLFDDSYDIYAPCARGEVIRRDNIDALKVKLVCGAANNQLQNDEMGKLLHEKDILYIPDFIANMGGVCGIQYDELDGLSEAESFAKMNKTIKIRLSEVFSLVNEEGITPGEAADIIVKQQLWIKTSKEDIVGA